VLRNWLPTLPRRWCEGFIGSSFALCAWGRRSSWICPILINLARQKGVSAYIGEGLNRWNAVHRLDAAHLYRLALEKAEGGIRYHGVGEESITFKAIAEAIGKSGDEVPVATALELTKA